MCFNCFINGDHRGHKFSIRESGGGVCDCGDPDGLKPSGYCKDHHGHSQLDESISSKDIQFFKERIMKLWIPILYYSSFKKNVNISQNKHQDILEAWDLLWKKLEHGFESNQNLILLTVDALTDFELLKKHIPGEKLDELIQNMELMINQNSQNLLPNLMKIFGDNNKSKTFEIFFN